MVRKYLLFILSFGLVSYATYANAGVWDTVTQWFSSTERQERPPTIRVLVGDDLDEAFLEVQGRYLIEDPYTNKWISSRFLGKAKTVEALPIGLRWGEEFPGIYQLCIKPMDRKTVISVNGVEYRGAILVYDTGGRISLVNEVDVEEFLRSTFTVHEEEIHSDEALAALAISARTNAYYHALFPRNTFWSVDAQHANYYGHLKNRNPRLEQALRSTRHMILSSTRPQEGSTTPFPLNWGPIHTYRKMPQALQHESKISLRQADDMGHRGDHAARILSKAFPDSSLAMIYQKDES